MGGLLWPRARQRRAAYALTVLGLMVLLALLGLGMAGGGALGVLALPLALLLAWMGGVNTVRRLHDMDRTGWHLLWIAALSALGNLVGQAGLSGVSAVLGLASLAVFLGLCLIPGTPGPNRYGPPPP
ncbi:DUF805 domain-containing protein [Roseococcus sp. DSY-14]|uniref:DUF805 domain-containing protein n=1 Tax=Roseococcus sp. DSY-14 TaxID=3369650 RepID=UPI00387B6BF4